jgi:hypothetical protein
MILRPMCVLAWCAVLCAAGTGLAFAEELPLAVPAQGEAFRAAFSGASKDGQLRFAVGGQPRMVPIADLLGWGQFVEPGPGSHVVLAGGGIVVADRVQIKGEQIGGLSPSFGEFALPLDVVAGVIVRPPTERAAGDKLLAKLLARGGRGDRLLLDNGDELAGTLTALDQAKAVVQTEAGSVDVPLDNLRAIQFDPTLVNQPPSDGLRIVVGCKDGSRVTAHEMASAGELVHLKLAAGVPLDVELASIVALQVLGGKADYLSDLKPASYRHIPYLRLEWPYRTDRGVTDALLRSGRRLYLKGLGMHSPSRITYELAQPYRRFDAEVAIDPDAGQRGSVDFRVFVDDGSGQWQERATSGVLRGGDAPKALSVDLAGAKRISLLVDFADRGDELDHANWLDARLVR